MSNDILPLVKVHDYFSGIKDEVLHEILGLAKVSVHSVGAVLLSPEQPVTSIGFLLLGRLKIVRVDLSGRESLLRMLERGEQYGMMIGALAEPVPARVITLESSTVLELEYEEAMDLVIRYPDLRRLWLKTFARTLKHQFFGSTHKRGPKILGLLHESQDTHATAVRLIRRLCELGEIVAVFSDSDACRELTQVRFRSLRPNGQLLGQDEIRQQIGEWQDASRIIFDVEAGLMPDGSGRFMERVDRVVYFVRPDRSEEAIQRLQSLNVSARGWRDKISIAWLLESGSQVAPVVPRLHELVCRDFKIADSESQLPLGRALTFGMERLVHDLRGVRIGVALGGGAARGMSHLGVLKALEQNGIVVDMIAGTSAGALTGSVYAAGLDGDYSANQFSTDLKPSWIFRWLPRGNQWFLLYQYRCGNFDPMLRKYLHDWRLEQLAIPCLSVTVDLVSGQSVVRERGDAVHAVLESINLPVLSVPICRDGQALIDGGLVNNIPADVLVSMGCNFVIAVSVTARMERQFCDMTPDSPPSRKKPSTLQTLLRSMLVQSHNLNAIGVQPADVVIEPDLTGFDLTEFMKAKELAAIGEQAALSQIPRIQQLLTRLDPQLFRWETAAVPEGIDS